MKLLRSFPLLIFLLMLVSLTGYCLAQKSVVLLLVAGTLAVVSWFVTEGPRGRTMPSWLSHLLVLGVSVAVILDWYQHQQDWMGVLGRYAIWLSLIKLFERKAPRDYGQLLAFSLLLMVTGSLQSADLLFSVSLLVYAVLGLYVLLLYQLHASYEQEKESRNANAPGNYRLAPMFKPVIGPRVGGQFRLTALLVGLVGILLSVIFFLSFPRGTGEDAIPGLPSPVQRRTAFLNQVNLGVGSRITQSRRPVMRVKLTDGNGRSLLNAPYLIRGGVMDRYHGEGQWRASPDDPIRIGTVPDAYTNLAEGIDPAAPVVNQSYKLDIPFDVLPTLTTPIALRTSSVTTFDYDPVSQLIRKPDNAGRLMAYEARSLVNPDRASSLSLLRNRSLRPGAWIFRDRDISTFTRRLLDSNGLNPNPPRDRREAWLWNRRAANVFIRYFESEEFLYSLDLSTVAAPGEGVDPIKHFLLETKTGHCEYFASGMLALCHSVGIQARLVTGFVAYEYDASAEEYVISESNAHAWVEVRTGPATWETFDPTPPAVVTAIHNIQPTLADGMQRIMSRLESGIGSRFLDFNEQDQDRLGSLLDMGWSDRLTSFWTAVRTWARNVNRAFNVGVGGYIWMGIVAFALIIAIIALVKLMRRSLRLRRTLQLQHIHGTEYQYMLRQLGFYLDMLYVLDKSGHEKPHWQPPAQFAEVLALSHPVAAGHVRSITKVFYAARYGRCTLEREEVRAVRTQLEALAAELHVKL